MEIKPPFSFLPSLFSPCGYFHSSFFSPAAFRRGYFSCILPSCLCPLSSSKNSLLRSTASLSPSSPLCAAYLLSSVVQVCRLLCYSSSQFSHYARWFSIDLALFQGQEKQKNLPCCSTILALPPVFVLKSISSDIITALPPFF